MIKDILVHLPTERPMRPVLDASISLAAALGAHLDGLAIGYLTVNTAYMIDAVAAACEAERRQAAQRVAAAVASFDTEARHARIAYECRSVEGFPAESAASLAAAARLYDLAVVLQPETERETFDGMIAAELLLRAGVPDLVVPHIFRGRFEAKRIGICWDGSRPAARAFKDAKPFLSQADKIVAIAINEIEVAPTEASARQLIQHMSRAGLTATLVERSTPRSDIDPSILSVAADANLDMLVMGAYGHSRLQEGIFGGVTREMLKTMTVPTLMSH